MYNFKEMWDVSKKIETILKSKSIPSKIKPSRYRSEIKSLTVSTLDSLESIMSKAGIPAIISEISLQDQKLISGKYSPKLVEITEDFSTLKKGDKFFFFSMKTSGGRLRDKDLTPDELKVQNIIFTNKSSMDSKIFAAISNLKNFDDDIISVLNGLYTTIANSPNNQTKVTIPDPIKKEMNGLSTSELNIIGKNFGEIISLRWSLNQTFTNNFTKFNFMNLSNYPLVDYVVYVKEGNKEVPINISAKFAQGAAPALSEIIKTFETSGSKFNTTEERNVYQTLKSLSTKGTGTISDRVLSAAIASNAPGIAELKKILNKQNFNKNDIQLDIAKIAKTNKTKEERIKAFTQKYSKFYDAVGSSVGDKSFNTVFYTDRFDKYHSLIISPLGYGLVKFLNNNMLYQKVLNNICRTLDVNQIYLNFSAGNSEMVFEKKIFSDSQFKFDWNSNAQNADNGSIKFSMIRK